MNSKLKFLIIGLVILLISGCLQTPEEKEQIKITPNATAISLTNVTEAPTPLITSVPAPKELPLDTLYVSARMLQPVYWDVGKYELTSLKVQVFNQQNKPLSIKAQIISGEQILEENSFILEKEGSSFAFTNEKTFDINNTNVTLRLLVQGYEPVEYKFKEVNSLG